jgi:site-specific recombinase XerD
MREPVRGYLCEKDVKNLIAAALDHKHGLRNATLILLSFKHALRVSEAISLRVGHIDFAGRAILCKRLKGSYTNSHPLDVEEISMLEKLIGDRSKNEHNPIFVKSDGTAISRQVVWRMIREAGIRAGLGNSVHPHMLKHATGYSLINRGHDLRLIQAYMGHREIMNTVRYTAIDTTRFHSMWSEPSPVTPNITPGIQR